jgi:hypothetical protein
MTINAHELGASLGEWNALVRRARISDRQKLAALTVSTYADADGTGIILSVARFAVDLDVSYSTARRFLTWLREVGLLEMTRAGNRRKGTASEYRLIIGTGVLDHIEVLSPTDLKAFADGKREAERSHTRTRTERKRKADQRSHGMSVEKPADEVDSEPDQRSPKPSVKAPINAQTDHDQRSPLDDLHTFPYAPSRQDLPSRADDEDLGTDVTGPRASHEEPTSDSSPRPKKCTHGLGGGLRTDGQPECALCRREQRAGPPPPEPPDPPPNRPRRCDHTPLPGKDRCRVCAADQDIAPVIDLNSRRTA